MRTHLSEHVTAQCVRDAEKRAGITHDEALGRRVDDDGDEVEPRTRSMVVRCHRGKAVRGFIVRLWVGDAVYEYAVSGTDPADAAKAARHAHAHAGLPSSTAWRARLA